MITRTNRIVGFVAALAALIPASTAAARGGGAEISHLYREDAGADFVVRDGDCGPARTQVGVGGHQHDFRSNTLPDERLVSLGVTIQVFDCGEQFVLGASGTVGAPAEFDVRGFLARARIDTTIEACQYHPGAGACFPVRIELNFRGVGDADTDRNDTDIREPDCRIIEHDRIAVRDARVRGTISFALPGQAVRTLRVDTDDLGDDGAFLSRSTEFQYFKGSSGSCVEQTG